MYIKIRKLEDKVNNQELSINISKKAKIEELREIIFKEWGIATDKQQLYYKGKQLIDDHCLMEYDIQLNDVIQLLIKAVLTIDVKNRSSPSTSKENYDKDAESAYYDIDDNVDMQDIHGAWFEGTVIKIAKKTEDASESDLVFYVLRLSEMKSAPYKVRFDHIRPRSSEILQVEDISVGDIVLANYNVDNPKIRGYWYDYKVTHISDKKVSGTIFYGLERTSIDHCEIIYTDEIFKIQQATLKNEKLRVDYTKIPLRKIPFDCQSCEDHPTCKCKQCGCKVCFGKNNWEEILLCDECNDGYHISCLSPPLTEIPQEDEWYCPECKTDENEIVKAGDKLKFSKKKARMPSAKEEGNARDWGKGMACVGRTRECTIVSIDHMGPVPGIEVGTCWKFRFQVSEAGIHRPLVGGIHGRESSCAYSIVLSGGYEDDIDYGDEFYYTGSGGRDLSGNKRVNEQSCDQALTRMNKALAMNCNVKFNPKDGAEAQQWKGGKPVRVVRNFKLRRYSNFAPTAGNRYDGIYKVVKYYPEKGKSGFIVWRYLLRRDDSSPAPWHKNGKELEMIHPPGYFEAQASKEKEKKSQSKLKRGAKRAFSGKPINEYAGMFKKLKEDVYKLDDDLYQKIQNDVINQKVWDECKVFLKDGKVKFMSKVEEVFTCICCQELVCKPITTICRHNSCKSCLQRSFSAEIYTCPYCRFELGKKYEFTINDTLVEILQTLFPGYEISR